MSRDKLIRADEGFERELKEILEKRLKMGVEKLPKINGTRRFTLALRRHRLWPQIKDDIIRADLKEDKELQ